MVFGRNRRFKHKESERKAKSKETKKRLVVSVLIFALRVLAASHFLDKLDILGLLQNPAHAIVVTLHQIQARPPPFDEVP